MRNMLRRLRLSGLTETLEVRLLEASGNRLSHMEFLELILQDELLVRDERKIGRRVKSASFRDQKSLEDFDWSFNPMIRRKQMYELATGRFIKERRDVLLCSAPGTGKSHLIQAIGYQLIKLGYVVLYRSIFDVVRDFLHDEAMDGHDRVMNRYLKPDLFHRRLRHEGVAQARRRVLVRNRDASLRNSQHDHDNKPPSGGLG
jgi:DNA replication protein DnaC